MWLVRLRRSEEGQALVAGVVLTLVVTLLIAAVLVTWTHSNDATVRDRSRTQGLQSAEAAVSTIIDGLGRTVCVPDVGLTSPSSLSVSGATVGQYQAMVRLPSEAGSLSPTAWNPSDASSPGCTSAPPSTQERVITAWGYGPSAGSTRRVVRKVEVTVQVSPLGGFRFACFAGGTAPSGVLTIKNNMVVNGDCYARTVSATLNNIIANGTLMSPGSVTTKNNAVYGGSIWAGGAVSVGENTTISGNVTSSTSSVTLLNNSQVLGNATAGTTITLNNGAAVHGVKCPLTSGAAGCPTNVPPTLSMPTIKCADTDVSCWLSLYPGVLNTSYTSTTLTTWLSNNKNNLSGTFYVNDSGTVELDQDSTITGPLTIITTGKLELSRTLDTASATTPPEMCTPPDGPRTCEVVLVSLNSASDAIHIKAPRFTANATTLSVLLYTKGTIQADSGANPITYSGSVYGGNLSLDTNGMTVTTSQDLVEFPPPLVDWSYSATNQFTVAPVSWRELPPVAP